MYQPPKGTRDFLPTEMLFRNSVIEEIKRVFESYGFEPLETPAIETIELLSAKGGGGEAIKKEIYSLKDLAGRELGLRFDLTVPAARVVAANPNLPKPFKRYTIDKVWRYDNPQAGRYREFLQADMDVFGTTTPESEAECLSAAAGCLEALGIKKFYIRINNRKLLVGIVRKLCRIVNTEADKSSLPEGAKEVPYWLDVTAMREIYAVLREIDKLDKIGVQKVENQLSEIKFGGKKIDGKKIMETLLSWEKIGEMLEAQDEKDGYAELQALLQACGQYGIKEKIKIDLSLVRGLEYYTGNIYEIVSEEGQELGVQVGSVGGGGRYDRLVELYGGAATPAAGISLGVERLIEIMKAQKKEQPKTKTTIFIANAGETKAETIKAAQELRKKGIRAETDLMGRKLSKQIEYAAARGIPFFAIIGEKEIKEGTVTLRDMKSGKQETLKIQELDGRLKRGNQETIKQEELEGRLK